MYRECLCFRSPMKRKVMSPRSHFISLKFTSVVSILHTQKLKPAEHTTGLSFQAGYTNFFIQLVTSY